MSMIISKYDECVVMKTKYALDTFLTIFLILGIVNIGNGVPCGNKTCGINDYEARCETNSITLEQECVCEYYWSGDECTIGPCDGDPCLNGGTCHIPYSYESPFNCECTPGWTGSLCERLESTTEPPFQTNKGKEFIFAFPENYKSLRGPKITIIPTTSKTNVRVSIHELNFTKSLKVGLNSVKHIHLPTSATIRNTNLHNNTVLIEASDDITVYGISDDHKASTDAFLALPVSALGSEYRVVGATARPRKLYKSQFVISGVVDNTTVRIVHYRKVLEYQGKSHRPAEQVVLTINRLESIQFQSDEDLTTTWIRSTEPISVLSGSRCGFIKTEALSKRSCEAMMIHLTAVEYWGRRFTLSPLKRSEGSDTVVRVISNSMKNNVIRGDQSRGAGIYNPSHFYEFPLSGDHPVNLLSFQPVMVVLYTSYTSITCRNLGDKCKGDAYFGQTMTQVPPLGFHYNSAYFTTQGFLPRFNFNLNILTKCDHRHFLILEDTYLEYNEDWLQTYDMCALNLEIAHRNYRLWSTKPTALFMAHLIGVRRGAAISVPVGLKLGSPDAAYMDYYRENNPVAADTPLSPTTTGKEFVFAFMVSSNSYTNGEPKVVMIADKDSDTDTYVTINTRDSTYEVVLATGGSQVVALPSRVMAVSAYDPRPPAAIQVLSSLPITVYGLNDAFAYEPRSDGFRVLSTDRLGTEYFLVSSYDPYGSYGEKRAQFVIIGLHDDTEVSLKVRGLGALFFDGALHYGGSTFRVRVQPLQTLFFASNDHQIGTHLISNKPVSVLSGSDCGHGSFYAYGDDFPETWPCEHQVEHLVPVQSWGRHFVIKEFAGYKGGDMYITIIAARDMTYVNYPDHSSTWLHSGGTTQYTTGPNYNNSRMSISASQPIMVIAKCDYAPITGCGPNCSSTDYSRPAMSLIPPMTPLFGSLAFVHLNIQNANHTYNYVDIVFECSNAEYLTVNDKNLTSWGITNHLKDGKYCSTSMELEQTMTYYLTANKGGIEVSAKAYGFSGTSSFAFPLL